MIMASQGIRPFHTEAISNNLAFTDNESAPQIVDPIHRLRYWRIQVQDALSPDPDFVSWEMLGYLEEKIDHTPQEVRDGFLLLNRRNADITVSSRESTNP